MTGPAFASKTLANGPGRKCHSGPPNVQDPPPGFQQLRHQADHWTRGALNNRHRGRPGVEAVKTSQRQRGRQPEQEWISTTYEPVAHYFFQPALKMGVALRGPDSWCAVSVLEISDASDASLLRQVSVNSCCGSGAGGAPHRTIYTLSVSTLFGHAAMACSITHLNHIRTHSSGSVRDGVRILGYFRFQEGRSRCPRSPSLGT